MRKEEIVGKRFGRLTVLQFDHSVGYRKYYLCKCDCGKEKLILKGNLMAGYTLSCGCLQKQRASKHPSLPDGYTRLRKIFGNMKLRCYNKNNNRYHRYGQRGITICDAWLNDVDSFCAWALANGYAPELTIDRIDNDKGYCPDNCRWLSPKQQSRNMSRNVHITYNGETKTLKEWAEILGIRNTTLHNRLHYYGWSIEKAFTTPVRNC